MLNIFRPVTSAVKQRRLVSVRVSGILVAVFMTLSLVAVFAADSCGDACKDARKIPVASASVAREASHDHSSHAADEKILENHSSVPVKDDGHGHDEEAKKGPELDDGHGHAKDDGHGHGENAQTKPIPERLKESCEHNVLTYQCDKCRFEVGAVKLSSATQALVKVETITTSPAPKVIDLVGELALDENHQRVVTSRLSGRLASLAATIGTTVKEGAVVAVVESGELAQGVLDYLKRISELNFAEKKLVRTKVLFEKKVGAGQDVQEAQSGVDLAELEARNAHDRLKIFGLSAGDIERVKKNRNDQLVQGKILLKSPLDGVVIQREGVVGEIIPGDRKLLTIANICHLKAIGQIQEKQLSDVFSTLSKGKIPVEVTVEAFPQQAFFGELVAVDTQMLEETRTLPVRIEVQNHDSLLRPGMFTKIRLFLETAQNQTLLPTSAIMEDEGSRFVFKQLEPNLFLRQEVVVGRKVGEKSIIQSGVVSGDIIAVDGAFLLKSDVLREKMGAGCAD